MILELKHVKKEDEMEAALKDAVSRRIQWEHDSLLRYEGDTAQRQYGLAFFDKRCRMAGTG